MKWFLIFLFLVSNQLFAKNYVFKLNDLKRFHKMGLERINQGNETEVDLKRPWYFPNEKYSQEKFSNTFAYLHKELLSSYPGKIMEQPRWIFNTAGGALGQLAILHCSIKEYLIFFCTPMATEAYTGHYKMEIRDYYLTGLLEHFAPGQFVTTKYFPGEMSLLNKGEGFNYKTNGGNCMLEYGRGNVLSGFKFGITGPAKYLTMDKKSSRAQIQDCTKAVFNRYKSKKKVKEVFNNSIPFKTMNQI